MKDFGYTISKDRQIDYDGNDRRIADYVGKVETSIRICMECGCCTATCSAGNFTEINIRKLHTLMIRGEKRRLLAEIEQCMLCGKCQLVCPRGVNLRHLILTIHQALEKFAE